MHASIGHQCCDQLTAVKTGYPLTSITWPYRGLRCWPIEVKYFLKLSADKFLAFKWSQTHVWFFLFIWNMFCFCAAQLKFWFKTDLGPENSTSDYREDCCFWLCLPWSRNGHVLRPFLSSDWSKFDRWAHAENLCSILNLVYFDSWSWQSFVSTCGVFNCLFPLDAQNEMQLLSGVFCYSWLVGFWLRN